MNEGGGDFMNKHNRTRGILAFAALIVFASTGSLCGEQLDYVITALNPLTWVVTARATATGETVQFRLHPSAFKGQTFDADLEGIAPGQKFRVRGPKNAVIGNAIVEQPASKAGAKGQGQAMRKTPPPSQRLAWEIIDVNAAESTMTARNRGNRTIVFKVDPKSFIGFRFSADLAGLEKGNGFTIIAPNLDPISENCVLIK
jgi:hypothetical protein